MALLLLCSVGEPVVRGGDHKLLVDERRAEAEFDDMF